MGTQMTMTSQRAELGEIGGGGEARVGDEPFDVAAVDGGDIGPTFGKQTRLGGIDIEAGRDEAGAGGGNRERQADIAQADDADTGRPGCDRGEERRRKRRFERGLGAA